MRKKSMIVMIIILLLNMSLSTNFYNIGHASTQTSSADQPEIIAVHENGKTNNRLNWKLLFNQQGNTWKERAVKMRLEGGQQVNDSELKTVLSAKGISAIKSDTVDNEYILNFTQLDKPVTVEISTEILNEDNNFRLTLTTNEAGAEIKASDTYYPMIEETGRISYQEVPEAVTAPPTIISLIDKATGTVVQQQTIQPDQTSYHFTDVRKLTDDNRPVEYEVKTEPLGNYKTAITGGNIEQRYLTAVIKGTIANDFGQPLTLQFIDKATQAVIDSLTVEKDAETYVTDTLPLNDQDGQKIDYEVRAADVDGYVVELNDFNITVTKLPEEATTEEATTEETTTEEAKTDEVTTEEMSTEESKSDDVTAEETKTEELPTDEAMTEETTSEEMTTEEATTEEATTEKPTEEVKTEEITTERPATTEAQPVESSVVYTAPKFRSFRTMSLASAPVTTLAAATAYSASDYTYTSNTYENRSMKATLEGVMATDQSKIDWTMTISNDNQRYYYTSNLEDIVVSNNLNYMTSLNLTNPKYNYSTSLNVTRRSTGAYTSEFKIYPFDTTLKFSTPITNSNQSSYSLTIGGMSYAGDYPVNLTGTFTLKEKSSAPVVKPVSVYSTAVTGTAAPGATINVMKGTAQVGTATADSSGNYSVAIPKQTVGTVLSVTSTEADKRVSDSTNVTVSSSVPMIINSVYSDQTYVTGTAEPGAMVTIKNSMGAVLGSTKASPDGLYFVELYRPLIAGTVITSEAVSTIGTKTATATVLAASSTGTPGSGVTIIEPSPTQKWPYPSDSWDERGLYRNRVPQPVEYNESFQWKAAQPTSTPNEYAIDLKTQGRVASTVEPLDIVLVLDVSASMNELSVDKNKKITNMYNSVKSFVQEITKANTSTKSMVRISVVTFGSHASQPSPFETSAAAIINRLPSTTATGEEGGTFTQQALNTGIRSFENNGNKKVMIVMTDGAPTFSYLGKVGTTAKTITEFDETKIKGSGRSYSLDGNKILSYDTNQYSLRNSVVVDNNGDPTISQANKNKHDYPSVNIFSVGMDTAGGSSGATVTQMNEVLNAIASKQDNSLSVSGSSEGLNNAISKISQSISNSISNGGVTDPIGPMYDLNLGSNNVFDASDYTLTASDPALISNGKVVPVYDPTKRTITIPNLNLGKGEWVNINYKVKLRVTDDSFVENQWYPMNERTTLRATPTTADKDLRDYPIPEARATSPVYSFSFNKLSDANTPLGGATFELKDAAGKVMTQTSSSNGLVKFDNLKKGTYTLTETVAPSGYGKDSKTYTVVIASNGDIKVDGVLYSGTNVFKVINKKVLGSIEVIKHQSGDESKVLAGATFELRDSTGKVVKTMTTGTDGKVLFSELPLGSYSLVETKAPAGYQLKSTPLKVEVTSATKVVVKVANQSTASVLPNTGGIGTWLFTLFGLLMIAVSLIIRKKFA
ncbi:SpaA isopeptide-forming pilin-related protein [Macrococcus bovicus]|uniref:VWA domain-containing protein n=1 Tax=Macrococcus bovicus TaxID=69968 RepID=A0A4R6C1D5_9STAP|nr:SpaA isopeptide-forming pilin-related protein [Macrococcus bovicus]TDM14931.1 VWA domain-containing protein [Macrococcus bovicus]